MNYCRRCRKDFGSVAGFDAHRVGKHAYLWSPDAEDGRRCLDTEELDASGWKVDSCGRWRMPGDSPFAERRVRGATSAQPVRTRSGR